MILGVLAREEDSVLVAQQLTVAHCSTVRVVIVWMTAQPLTLTLDPMRTSLVVSKNISLHCSQFYIFPDLHGIKWINVYPQNTHAVCSIPCDPGYTLNTASCSCELTDGCEAAGQPCQNGGTCTSDLSAPAGGPYYTCTCAGSFSGQNCTG